MTAETCLKFCGDKSYAGLEYGRECWCAASLNAQAQKLDDKECNLQCLGNKAQVCGGNLMLTAYKRTSDAVAMVKRRGWTALGAGLVGLAVVVVI